MAVLVSIAGGVSVAARLAPSELKSGPANRSNPDDSARELALSAALGLRYNSKTQLIWHAIKTDSKISFSYTKPGESVSEYRTISPAEFRQIQRPRAGGTTLCVVGFCETRGAERTFAVDRMTNIQLTDVGDS